MVEGARLESEACEEHRGKRRDLNAHALNELATWKCTSSVTLQTSIFLGVLKPTYHSPIPNPRFT